MPPSRIADQSDAQPAGHQTQNRGMVIGFLHDSRRLQASTETRLHQTVIGGRIYAPGKANKLHAIQIAKLEPRLPGDGMSFRRSEYYLVLRYWLLIQFFAQCFDA